MKQSSSYCASRLLGEVFKCLDATVRCPTHARSIASRTLRDTTGRAFAAPPWRAHSHAQLSAAPCWCRSEKHAFHASR
eukprot:6209974-Pleurochrysis_carterae.AAC.4